MIIDKEAVLGAIKKIDKEGIPKGKHSSTYDLIHDNRSYPPKLIYSTAHQLKTGEDLPHDSFEGGENTKCFNELRSLGFEIKEKSSTRKFWLYAAGENAELWNENFQQGIMSLGWDELGDLRNYDNKESIQNTLKLIHEDNGSRKNDALANFEFCYSISKGDIVIAKQGTKKYIGFGEVLSDYEYVGSREKHRSIRRVNWKSVEVESSNIVQKTLTDISKYPLYVLILIKDLKIFGDINYWFVAQGDSYNNLDGKKYLRAPRLDKNGNAKVYWDNMTKVKQNDIIFNYSNKELKGFSIAVENCSSGINPYSSKWNQEGYSFRIDHFPFKSKIRLGMSDLIKSKEQLSIALRGVAYKPFNNNGGVNQGYLYEFSEQATQILIDKMRNKELMIDSEEDSYKNENGSMEGLNLILYGPPGTGKTYTLKTQFFPIFEDEKEVSKEEFIASKIKGLTWKNALGLVLLILKEASVKEIIESKLLDQKIRTSNAAPENISNILWRILQYGTKESCKNVKVGQRDSLQIFWKDENSNWTVDENILLETAPELGSILKEISSFKIILGKQKRYVFTTFHQSYSYEDFIEGLKPQVNEDGTLTYGIVSGVFREIVDLALKDPNKPYAIFIDEINRGNVASIFGELITLIEEDKRIGEENYIPVKLPYSKDEFGIPKNLHIIGTMNTADKSVEQLDAALRRRFQFISLDSTPEILETSQFKCKGINLEKLLRTINERIEVLLDQDHKIGHAYFMSIKDLENPLVELKSIFLQKIIPQLKDYFFNDYQKIEMILGSKFISKSSSTRFLSESSYFHEEIQTYKISNSEDWTLESFRSIYE